MSVAFHNQVATEVQSRDARDALRECRLWVLGCMYIVCGIVELLWGDGDSNNVQLSRHDNKVYICGFDVCSSGVCFSVYEQFSLGECVSYGGNHMLYFVRIYSYVYTCCLMDAVMVRLRVCLWAIACVTWRIGGLSAFKIFVIQ